jgi:hypothetical protein
MSVPSTRRPPAPRFPASSRGAAPGLPRALLSASIAASIVLGLAVGSASDPEARRLPFADRNGDANGDGRMDLSDAVYILSWLFTGGPAPAHLRCEVAGHRNGDVNGDGRIDLSDAVYLLAWRFTGGPAPVPGCGQRPAQEEETDDEVHDLSSLLFLQGRGPLQRVVAVPGSFLQALRPYPVYKLRIHAIRTADNDGSNAATITPNQIRTLVEQANSVYYSAGIEFEFDPETDFEHKDATILNRHFTLLEDPKDVTSPDEEPATSNAGQVAFRRAFADLHRGKVAVFFSYGSKLTYDEAKGHWVLGPSTGGSSSWAGRWVNMPRGMPEINLLAHELGHYLHNRHPFGAAPGSVPEAAEMIRKYVEEKGHPVAEGLDVFDGDRAFVLDTPPDPRGGLWESLGFNKCGPPDSISIPVKFSNNDTHIYEAQPARDNIMSYFKGCHDLYHHLSPQQVQRTRNALEDLNRHDLISLRAGFLPYAIDRKGSADGDPIDEVDVVRVSRNRLVTAAIKSGTLKVTAWDVSEDGETITRRGEGSAGPVSAAASCAIGLGMLATAVRDGNGNLKVILWQVTPNGSVVRKSSAAGGAVSQIAACRLGNEFIATAVRDGNGDLKVIVWQVTAGGGVERRGSASAGAVDQISVASIGSLSVATAVRDGAGNLKVIVWQASGNGNTVERKDSESAGPVLALEGTNLEIDVLTTAVRTQSGNLKVISWHIDHFGQVRRKGSAEGGPANRIDSTRLGVDLLVTAVRDAGGNLRLDLWEVDIEASEVKPRASAGAGGSGRVAIARAGSDTVVAAVRTLSGNLKLIAWKVRNQTFIPFPGQQP